MTISAQAHRYIRERPSVAECLEQGLINHSALARQICAEINLDAFDAVLVACRRYRSRVSQRRALDRKIQGLMRKAKVRTRNRMAVIIIEKSRTMDKALAFQKLVREEKGDFHLIEGEDAITIVTNADYLAKAREFFEGRILRINKEVALLSMIFDESVENIPGVVATVYRLLAHHGVNIRQEWSCWTDLLMVIDDKDVARVVQALSGRDE